MFCVRERCGEIRDVSLVADNMLIIRLRYKITGHVSLKQIVSDVHICFASGSACGEIRDVSLVANIAESTAGGAIMLETGLPAIYCSGTLTSPLCQLISFTQTLNSRAIKVIF